MASAGPGAKPRPGKVAIFIGSNGDPPKLPQHIQELLDKKHRLQQQEQLWKQQQQHMPQQVQTQAGHQQASGSSLRPTFAKSTSYGCQHNDMERSGTVMYARHPDVRRAYLSMIETGGHGV